MKEKFSKKVTNPQASSSSFFTERLAMTLAKSPSEDHASIDPTPEENTSKQDYDRFCKLAWSKFGA